MIENFLIWLLGPDVAAVLAIVIIIRLVLLALFKGFMALLKWEIKNG